MGDLRKTSWCREIRTKVKTDRTSLGFDFNITLVIPKLHLYLLRKLPSCGMDSNFRIIAPPMTFVNQRHQIPFPRVYVSIIERRLKFLLRSLAHNEDCAIAGKNLQINLRRKIIEDKETLSVVTSPVDLNRA